MFLHFFFFFKPTFFSLIRYFVKDLKIYRRIKKHYPLLAADSFDGHRFIQTEMSTLVLPCKINVWFRNPSDIWYFLSHWLFFFLVIWYLLFLQISKKESHSERRDSVANNCTQTQILGNQPWHERPLRFVRPNIKEDNARIYLQLDDWVIGLNSQIQATEWESNSLSKIILYESSWLSMIQCQIIIYVNIIGLWVSS